MSICNISSLGEIRKYEYFLAARETLSTAMVILCIQNLQNIIVPLFPSGVPGVSLGWLRLAVADPLLSYSQPPSYQAD